MAKKGVKQVTYTGGGAAPIKVKVPADAELSIYHDPSDAPPVIRELPTCRVIEFYGERLSFVPSGDTLWLSHYDALAALCLNPNDEEAQAAWRNGAYLYLGDVTGYQGGQHKFVSICHLKLIARHLSFAAWRETQYDRATRLLEVVSELQRQNAEHCLIHTHTLPNDSQRLRAVLDKHPLWEEVLALWNAGQTQGEISLSLSINLSKVKSALKQLRRWGFDVVSADLRQEQKRSGGRTVSIPRVAR